MIRKVLDFKDLTAREVMVPRRHILGIELAMPIADVVSLVVSEKHSRYPVYRENIDNVVGLLYAKDLFVVARDGKVGTPRLAEILRTPVLFVSENQSAAKILQDMRSRRMHVAIVSDEFGGTAGLITLEDIIEEIVGDIRDEHDVEAPIQAFGDGRIVADASVPLLVARAGAREAFPGRRRVRVARRTDQSRAGRVPQVGATVQARGPGSLTVREADETRVVRVEIVPESAPRRLPRPRHEGSAPGCDAPRDDGGNRQAPEAPARPPLVERRSGRGRDRPRCRGLPGKRRARGSRRVQVPPATALPPGAPVVVFGGAIAPRRFWTRILGDTLVPVTRAARCGALIARGYVDVGAGLDATTKADLAWGFSPERIA